MKIIDNNIRLNNSLNLFKLIAALQVMYVHIVNHLDIGSNIIFDKIFGIFLGVPIFFTLSGFLIWLSIDRTVSKSDFSNYVKKRFLRIYPEMWVAIIFEILVMFVFYRGSNFLDIFLFFLAQSTFFQFWTPNSLREYGCGTPNGSLWTIGVTIQFYFVAWFIYKFMKNKGLRTWMVVIFLSIIISVLGSLFVDYFFINEIFVKLYHQTILRYLWMFLLGMFAACFFDKIIPFCKKWWYVIFSIGVVISISGLDIFVDYGIFKTLLIFLSILGFSYKFPKLKLKNDISFGIFIYHMTVVNAMISLGLTGKFIYLVIASITSCILGYLSTILIGSYVLKKKNNIFK